MCLESDARSSQQGRGCHFYEVAVVTFMSCFEIGKCLVCTILNWLVDVVKFSDPKKVILKAVICKKFFNFSTFRFSVCLSIHGQWTCFLFRVSSNFINFHFLPSWMKKHSSRKASQFSKETFAPQIGRIWRMSSQSKPVFRG